MPNRRTLLRGPGLRRPGRAEDSHTYYLALDTSLHSAVWVKLQLVPSIIKAQSKRERNSNYHVQIDGFFYMYCTVQMQYIYIPSCSLDDSLKSLVFTI